MSYLLLAPSMAGVLLKQCICIHATAMHVLFQEVLYLRVIRVLYKNYTVLLFSIFFCEEKLHIRVLHLLLNSGQADRFLPTQVQPFAPARVSIKDSTSSQRPAFSQALIALFKLIKFLASDLVLESLEKKHCFKYTFRFALGSSSFLVPELMHVFIDIYIYVSR